MERMEPGVLCIPLPYCLRTGQLMSASERIDGSVPEKNEKWQNLIPVHWVCTYFSFALQGPLHQRQEYIMFHLLLCESIWLFTKMDTISTNFSPAFVFQREVVPFICFQIQRPPYNLNMMFDHAFTWYQYINVLCIFTNSISPCHSWETSQGIEIAVALIMCTFWNKRIMLPLVTYSKTITHRFWTSKSILQGSD